MPNPSERGRQMPASPIRRLVPLADRARARGVHVHSLNIGQPDVETPRGMIEAYRSFDERVLAYGPSEGLPELRQKVAGWYQARGHAIDAGHVQVTFGGSEAVQFALTAICDPGDEVIVSEPFYANYAGFATESGVRVRPVAARVEDGFRLPPTEAFEAACTDRTRAVIISSPGNPAGTIYSREEMDRLNDFIRERDLFLISDEVYADFAYDGVPVTSALSLDGAEERVVVIDSVSKRFSACGARVGFAITRNPELASAFTRMCYARLCPATVDQLAAIAAYDTPSSYFEKVVRTYEARRNVLVDGLLAIEGVQTYRPEGAFYTMAKFPVADIDHFAAWMLESFSHREETVLMAPGTGFYGTPGAGKQEARIAYVVETPALERAVQALRAGLAAYPGP